MLRKYNIDKIIHEEIIEFIAKKTNKRAGKIIGERFGLGVKNTKTLGQIGDNYNITRERVRQIISETMNGVRESLNDNETLQSIENKIKFTVNKNHGIISKRRLLLEVANNKKEENFVNFILHCSLVLSLEKEVGMESSVVTENFDLEEWDMVNKNIKSILEKKNDILDKSTLQNEFLQKVNNKKIEINKIFAFLDASSIIKKNIFNKWGLADWQTITPRGVGQKAYLVIRETGKPLHFRDIARLIEKFKFDKKKAHPQTVHNELIKNKKFILVGRGMYALSEWGYQSGTVREVIKGILEESGRPLAKNEIIEKVLTLRNVRPATVIINLNNFFKKADNKKYFL